MDEIAAPAPDDYKQWMERSYGPVRIIDGQMYIAPAHTPDRIFHLPKKQQAFLFHLAQEADFQTAAKKAGMSIATAKAFVRSATFRDLGIESKKIHAKVASYTAQRLIYERIRQFEGESILTDSQNKGLEALERHILPKKQDGNINASTVNVQVNNFQNLPPDIVAKLKAIGDAEARTRNAA